MESWLKIVRVVLKVFLEIDHHVIVSHYIDISPEIFVNLEPGIYYLRVEVDWINERALNRGNILIYASQRNVEVKSK